MDFVAELLERLTSLGIDLNVGDAVPIVLKDGIVIIKVKSADMDIEIIYGDVVTLDDFSIDDYNVIAEDNIQDLVDEDGKELGASV